MKRLADMDLEIDFDYRARHLPNAAEIARECEKIQAHWTDAERYKRAKGVNGSDRPCLWLPPQIGATTAPHVGS